MQTMHLLPGVAIQPNLELKTRPKPVLGSLPLAFVLPAMVFGNLCVRRSIHFMPVGWKKEKNENFFEATGLNYKSLQS